VDVTAAHAAAHDRKLTVGADPPDRLEVAEVNQPIAIDHDSPSWMRASIGCKESAGADEARRDKGISHHRLANADRPKAHLAPDVSPGQVDGVENNVLQRPNDRVVECVHAP
jgi:hypothetical protein